ncbi:hypothetical protein HDZ31DRAFT_67715 [Schizophyllum fasciatum]
MIIIMRTLNAHRARSLHAMAFPADEEIQTEIVDVHCHPTDSPIPHALLAQPGHTICAMATRRADQARVAALARAYPKRVVPAFGYHPWFSHHISVPPATDPAAMGDAAATSALPLHTPPPPSKADHYRALLAPKPHQESAFAALLPRLPDPTPLPAILADLRANLAAFPGAMLGEVGLDRAFRVPIAGKYAYDEGGDAPADGEHGDAPAEAAHNRTDAPTANDGTRTLSPFTVPIAHQLAVLEAQTALAVALRARSTDAAAAAHQRDPDRPFDPTQPCHRPVEGHGEGSDDPDAAPTNDPDAAPTDDPDAAPPDDAPVPFLRATVLNGTPPPPAVIGISLHAVKAPKHTLDFLDRMKERYGDKWRALSVDLHSCGLSPEMWRAVEAAHPNAFLSLSTGINMRPPREGSAAPTTTTTTTSPHLSSPPTTTPTTPHLPSPPTTTTPTAPPLPPIPPALAALIAAAHPARLLAESDWHAAGASGPRTWDALRAIAAVRGWAVEGEGGEGGGGEGVDGGGGSVGDGGGEGEGEGGGAPTSSPSKRARSSPSPPPSSPTTPSPTHRSPTRPPGNPYAAGAHRIADAHRQGRVPQDTHEVPRGAPAIHVVRRLHANWARFRRGEHGLPPPVSRRARREARDRRWEQWELEHKDDDDW